MAAQSDVPTFLSILTQIPFLQLGLGEKRLGVICASASAMNDRIYEQCNIRDPDHLVITEMKGRPEFDRFIRGDRNIDFMRLESETVEAAKSLTESDRNVGAIMLQCSDLPPFSAAVQSATGLPVFDASTLIMWAHLSSLR